MTFDRMSQETDFMLEWSEHQIETGQMTRDIINNSFMASGQAAIS